MYIRFFYMGKRVNKNIRPLKMMLSSRDEVLCLLKNKAKIAGQTNLRIAANLTPMQHDHMAELRRQLKTQTLNGEQGITFKFVHGIPKIVKRGK